MQTYNLQKLQELLHDFYNLTGIKICFYDDNENEVCFFPERLTDFCQKLRSHPDLDAKCRECDRLAFATCKKTLKQYVYSCHSGLLECVSPIVVNGTIIGYIVIGQIKADNCTDFLKTAKYFDAQTAKKLQKSFNELPAMSMDKINSAIHILDACAGYEYLKNILKQSSKRIDNQISSYINKNLSGDLSVETLCSKFRTSKTELYALFKEYFNSSVADFIKKRRLNEALNLLENTNYPVNKIAEKCGIPDYNYFSKVFKREFNVSPREYRKKSKENGFPAL